MGWDGSRYAHQVFENLWRNPSTWNKIITVEENKDGYVDTCQKAKGLESQTKSLFYNINWTISSEKPSKVTELRMTY